MEQSCVKINDLPDEILMIILRNLHTTEVFYSLIGVSKTLNRIAHDSNFTNSLALCQRLSNDRICPLPDPILDRFCLEILPEIYHKIQWLYVEPTSMERIFRVTTYPNLYGLSVRGIDLERAISLFTNDTIFTHVIKNQISSLVIDINQNERQISAIDINKIVFTPIFTMFINLQFLNFGPSSIWYQRLSFDISPPVVYSSTLLELHVCVEHFTDCLYLLDGRFNQLRTFHINIYRISSRNSTVNAEKKLANLKCFSLYCDMRTHVYDELVLPLLRRMLNLEKLNLHLKVDRYKGFVDGNDLKKNIINHMPLLIKFTFNIRSFNRSPNQLNIPTNKDIQNTFKNFPNNQIISFVDYFQEGQYSQCYIYSYPYRINYYEHITNNFPGGLFQYVSKVSLNDERPFEHEFFVQIQKSFPLMRNLTVRNTKPQKNKYDRKSNNDNRDLSIIKYFHLTLLDLQGVHDDYIEQFLVDTKMCLPNNVHLLACYQSLEKVTHNFQRDATRINCEKVNYFCSDNVR